jgi:hypothetical protein
MGNYPIGCGYQNKMRKKRQDRDVCRAKKFEKSVKKIHKAEETD